MHYWIALNLIITLFITFATVFQPFSVKILILNSQFSHYLVSVVFFTTLFSLKFLFKVFVSACNLEITYCIAFFFAFRVEIADGPCQA